MVDHLDDLISTIRSRCQSFPSLLLRRLIRELIRLGADKESASISAGVAEGSLQIAKMQLLQKEELKEIESA